MGIEEIQRMLLDECGLRVTPEMGEYILASLKVSGTGDVAIIGGDAKTGVPIRTTIPAADLHGFIAAQS